MPTSHLCIGIEGDCTAIATFEAHGEHWEVCDGKVDGYGARLYMTIDQPDPESIADFGGADGECTELDDEIPEGTKVKYKLCLTDNRRDITDSCLETGDTA